MSTDCTTVCHYAGDANANYTKHGHGRTLSTYKYKAGVVDFTAGSNYISIKMACTSCHASLDTSDTSASRKAHVETAPAGTTQERHQARYNLNLPVQAFDDGSNFGNPLYSVCFSCHSSYDKHQGNAVNSAVGCQDCHDEHAEGSGTGSNYFMIPETSKPQGTDLHF